MHYNKFVLSVFVFGVHITCAQTLGVSSKLDFGSDSTVGIYAGKSPGSSSTAGLHLSPSFERKSIHVVEKQDTPSLETIGVVCVSGSCNTTKSKTENKDGISTDVLVHVQTKVDLNQAKNDTKEETSDVPVIVGYGGANGQSRPNLISNSAVLNPTPVVVTNIDQSYPQVNRRVSVDNVFVPTPHPFLDSFPQVDVNVQTHQRPVYVPTITNDRDYKNVRYDSNNAIEVQIPYFEPSFNTHYFGEHPPPQFVWHPRGKPVYNPLEFKSVYRPTWNPPHYRTVGNAASGRPLFHPINQVGNSAFGTDCTCTQNVGPNQGSTWYTTPSNIRVRSAKPKSHIDNKLAPLNN